MISNFNEEAEEILIKAKLEMLELCHPYVGTEHLVLAILHTKNELAEKLSKYNLTYTKFKKALLHIIGKGSKKSEFFLHTPLLKKVIENAIMDSKDNNNGIVTINHLFTSLLDVGEGIAIRILIGMNINLDDIYDEIADKIYDHGKTEKKLLIENIGINLNEKVKNNEIDPVIGREKEINKLEEILCRRTKNNPLLIGDPGVGKTAIVEDLATLIENNNVPEKLSHKKIISLDMASAVAGTKYRGEFEERMKKILDELEDHEEIIVFIDEIHTLIGAGGAEGAIDASNILKPALARGKIRCIGATTNDEYKKHFEKDKALERRFQVINIEEPTLEETKNILYKLKPIYEKYHNVTIKNDVIDKLITLTEK
ncbi:MAG: ATP-dependent Clp protease ATP-binding subunit, partial [Bacilli bacterium]|nr:ATP-dependent Clp protease ATP-binding subunit [Bacilli bacterium]